MAKDKKEMTGDDINKHNAELSAKIKEVEEKSAAMIKDLKSKMMVIDIKQATLLQCNQSARQVKPAAPKKG